VTVVVFQSKRSVATSDGINLSSLLPPPFNFGPMGPQQICPSLVFLWYALGSIGRNWRIILNLKFVIQSKWIYVFKFQKEKLPQNAFSN